MMNFKLGDVPYIPPGSRERACTLQAIKEVDEPTSHASRSSSIPEKAPSFIEDQESGKKIKRMDTFYNSPFQSPERSVRTDTLKTKIPSKRCSKTSEKCRESATDIYVDREDWSVRATMIKILCLIDAGVRPVNMKALVRRGPRSKPQAVMCFRSILRLAHHGFIRVEKDPADNSILDITLGPAIIVDDLIN